MTLALPAGTSTVDCMLSFPTNTVTSESFLVPRQEWDWAPATSTQDWATTSEPTSVHDLLQPQVGAPITSYSQTDVPSATTAPKSQDEAAYTPARDNFGSRSILVIVGVVGVVVLVVLIWAIIAHRTGQRPFACFGGCRGRNKDIEAARSGSMNSDIPLVGAGRHYDRRPVSVQPQPFPMAEPQRPEPVQHQTLRLPVAKPEWARQF
ncbi:hypothetical protein EJ07DRAFT_154339 [Lizonia empirigonia]|nr:hypothetical protein EJ07DRAFT_154339 [Lizonia empirigonia]